MSSDTAQFIKFIGLLIGMSLLGAFAIAAGLPRIFAIPFGLAWILAVLAGIGFIIDGKEGAKALVSYMLITWALIGGAAAFILLLS